MGFSVTLGFIPLNSHHPGRFRAVSLPSQPLHIFAKSVDLPAHSTLLLLQQAYAYQYYCTVAEKTDASPALAVYTAAQPFVEEC